MRHQTEAGWKHPGLRVERATRAIIVDRLSQGATHAIDRALMAMTLERQAIERAGRFN